MQFEQDAIETSGAIKPVIPENRRAIVELPQDFLIGVLEGRFELCGWPKDARIIGVSASFEFRSIRVMVESQEFAPIPQGQVLPTIATFWLAAQRVKSEKIFSDDGTHIGDRHFYVSERAERIETPDGKVKFREWL